MNIKMYKRVFFLLCIALLNIICAQSKNVVSSFFSFMNSKINSKKEISKIIQMGDALACLTNNENSFYNECSCSFTKIKDFEKKCSSNLKKNQEEAKNCSEEHCEICCILININNTTNSILESELSCKKKCTKSNLILNLNEDDYKLSFKKLIEFIRIFFPSNILNYYSIEKKNSPEYTNRLLDTNYQKIKEDLNSETDGDKIEEISLQSNNESEELFSPYNEN
ncbi:secreted ookinete protein, putative [Plasmodium gallinaceum]|uniref:Secreted ookinete protein, putative n=1 Tax=Plasmodium gallinaceum TaxID=5849 RepID=A0A1J1GZH2_PLAGA|nr:secreted ookinete protein, putative [Plasmodium gallinaceum]CRG97625.1 secreted ookinete protein, putative [Plasmodium gallinaceum]